MQYEIYAVKQQPYRSSFLLIGLPLYPGVALCQYDRLNCLVIRLHYTTAPLTQTECNLSEEHQCLVVTDDQRQVLCSNPVHPRRFELESATGHETCCNPR
jgi:hypothetical protein